MYIDKDIARKKVKKYLPLTTEYILIKAARNALTIRKMPKKRTYSILRKLTFTAGRVELLKKMLKLCYNRYSNLYKFTFTKLIFKVICFVGQRFFPGHVLVSSFTGNATPCRTGMDLSVVPCSTEKWQAQYNDCMACGLRDFAWLRLSA
jgi:hypothetical protein